VKDLARDSDVIDSAYRGRFADRHQQRLTQYRNVIQLIQEHSDYRAVERSEAELALAAALPLGSRLRHIRQGWERTGAAACRV
jgi:hypothetical protein